MELFEQYVAETRGCHHGHPLNQARRDIGTFVDCVGSTLSGSTHRQETGP